MSKKSPVKKPKEPQPESQPEAPLEPVTSTTQPDTPVPAVIAPTIESIHQELESLKQLVGEHAQLITQLQEALARKRKPVPNGKVQILDKQTGQVFPSKNNAYQTLLKSGELKDLVGKGVFGDIPEKNTFGWYALVRELPDRFEEVKQIEETQQ